ncbi:MULTISPECIES: prepilin peptidase-dependent pilin [Photorhabdus]|uniref:Prepilin peptidase-dependent pilin n=2 Tax=Photorhabdus TaxID=29487 RepID=A0A2S8R3J9_9GAMM|nr:MULTISPECIES: prepilin peptidase-dependent pilin [Photorhabdus]EYU15994.1 prepilin-type cleavage/methylation [Photorhabdus aegyptia]MCC8456992.1 prepilin peptidase-dependent pilin [Photorhabdus aegyptia]PQQ23792.1 prepilin peptidase-dependent pilin [Photorhabdus hindustanensis]PQQ42150.1 prepilin peptidase-dependent pilin [Photorhabdus luminescens]
MKQQQGFTLMEIMVAIAIISILSAIGIPSYQGYIQKAALTDILQNIVPYKSGIELCGFETEDFMGCNAGAMSIPKDHNSRYIESISVKNGEVTINGEKSLKNLSITLKPTQNTQIGTIKWNIKCESTNNSLKNRCQEIFEF